LERQKALLKAMAVLARDRYQTIEGFQSSLLVLHTAEVTCAEKKAVNVLKSSKKHVIDEEPVYFIDYESGEIPVGELPIGSRLVDITWQWEFRTDSNYTGPGKIESVVWIIVAKDHYEMKESHITLLSDELIGKYCFDLQKKWWGLGKVGDNQWGMSGATNSVRGLRPWLNSNGIHKGDGFYAAFSQNFKNIVILTTLPNRRWDRGKYYHTRDYVFIPSSTELGDSDHRGTYPIGSAFPYFAGSQRELRISQLNSEDWYYWTRSPGKQSVEDNYVKSIFKDGEFFNYSSTTYSDDGIRPALNIKSEIRVSESSKL